MDVRDAGGDRVHQDLLQVADDRRVLDLGALLVARGLAGIGLLEVDLEVLHRGAGLLQQGAGGFDELVDRRGELVVLDDDGLDDQIGLEPDLLEALQIRGIGGGDEQAVAALMQRQNVPRLGNLEVDQVLLQQVGVEPGQIEQRDPERPRCEDRELVRRDPLAREHVIDEAHAGLLRLRLQRLGLVLRHQPVLGERARESADVPRRCGVRCHGLEGSNTVRGFWAPNHPERLSNSCAVSATTA